jgi:hypothetical protein
LVFRPSGVSIFYSYFAALGLDIRLEDTTNKGRIDMAALFEGQVFLFEFKVVELTPEGRALQQIKARVTLTSTAHTASRFT